MPSERPGQWLEDIADNIRRIEDFISGMDLAGFRKDARTRYAVLYALLSISEAARRLPEDLKGRHPKIPWRDIADSGNVYRYQYHSLDPEIVWKTLKKSLPALKKAVAGELAQS